MPESRQSRRILGVSVAFVVTTSFALCGLTGLCVSGYLSLHAIDVLKRPRAEGIVARMQQRSGSKMMTWAPVFRFRDQVGQEFIVEDRTSSSPAAFAVGDIVSVAYRPDDPSDARIVAFGQLWILPIGFSLVALFFAVTGGTGVISVLRRRKNATDKSRLGDSLLQSERSTQSLS